MNRIYQLLCATSFALAVVALLLSAAGAAVAHETEYDVGVAKVDVTPEYPIRLNGFGGRREESEGITQRIWAKALAIGSDAEEPVVLVTVDSCGIRLSMVDEVARRLKEKAGIERDRLAVTFTHSHTTPKLTGVCDTIFSTPIPPEHQKHIDRYTAELTDALERVALAALADRQAARLEWSTGKVGFAKNRRTEGGPVDHDLPMLVVKSVAGDEVRAIYVTYACHCVTLSHNMISGDWAGYAAEAIERENPGATALVSIGCGSDSNPSSGVTGDNIAAAVAQGAEIADEVERLRQGPLKPISGSITAKLRNIELPLLKIPSRDELEKLAAEESPAGYNAKFQLAKLDRGETLQAAIDYPIQIFSFGDSLTMVFLAGEVCVDYSLRLKQELDPRRIWLHGYSNDFCCYVPSERLLREGGYGGGAEVVYFALPSTLQAGLEDKIIAAVHEHVPKVHRRKDVQSRSSTTKASKPAEAVSAIETSDEFIVDLVAAEPLVADPVAIDFGGDGRLWVVEMTDYSRAVDEEFDQSGSVKFLVDHDRDGTFDAATVFAENLRFPTDVKVWRNGIIVCDAPDVIYFEDTDGDGKADLRKVLLTGFETHNAQARVNSLRWGLDNWVYGSCGLFGGKIRSFSGQTLDLGARDFRFNPDSGEIEAVTGRTQQGRARDDWGNWFGCENSTLCEHYPMSEQYLSRNPHLIPPPAEVFVPSGDDPNRLFPIGPPVLFKLSGAPGRPTAACGLEIYRDDLLGAELRGNVFVAEPVNQLVHRLKLKARDISFTGCRAEDESQHEFLASSDNWFRPVQIRTGPDGALWIVDMCRYVIEHPRFIPEETLRTLDPMAGRGAGRIFRVRLRDAELRKPLRLSELDTAELVTALDSPNGTQRDLAHEMIVQHGDPDAVPLLESLALTSSRAETRLHALCALDGLHGLREEVVMKTLQDPHPGVRRHAIRLSESFLDKSETLGAAVAALISDPDPQVQLQLAYSLGEWNDARSAAALAQLFWRHRADPYLVAATLSSTNETNAGDITRALLDKLQGGKLTTPLSTALVTIATCLGDDACRLVILKALMPRDSGDRSVLRLETLANVLESTPIPARQQLIEDAERGSTTADIAETMRRIVLNPKTEEKTQLAALRVLTTTGVNDNSITNELAELLSPQNSPAIQQAAIKLASRMESPLAAELLLVNWNSYSPTSRAQVLEVFLSRNEFMKLLLKQIGAGAIKPTQLDALQRQRLLTHGDREIRSIAISVFDGAINSDRKKIVESFASAPHPSADAAEGRIVFRKHCENCHRLEEQGHVVGPDLAALTNRSTTGLLEALFDPNRAVDERYQSYTAVCDDGRVYTGILTQETSNSITLVEQAGKEHTLLRASLEDLSNSGISLMPEGFEKDLSSADVANLLAYLLTQGAPPKTVTGNEPKTVIPRDDGAIWLLAADSAIYGGDIIFESEFKNIGYWHSADDHVAWNVDVSAPGSYDVYLDWACDRFSAGNAAVIDGLAAPLVTVIPSTGGWDKYQMKYVGRSYLAAGPGRIVVRPHGVKIAANLMDLRGVYLVAVDEDSEPAPPELSPSLPQPADGATEIAALLDGLAVGTPAEYEGIPAIWKAAIAAGRRNDTPELRRVLMLALPAPDVPLEDWQAVVLGGGIVNGLSQVGVWPRTRIGELVDGHRILTERWERTILLARAMAEDKSVRSGTRYDALRILGADTFDRSGPLLQKYLAKSAGHDLQMGAVSGLSDIESPAVVEALLDSFENYHHRNQDLAVEALLRTMERTSALLDALESGRVSPRALTPGQTKKLLTLDNAALRQRAEKLLK